MKIITCPAFTPNGGIRIILEVAHRLNATIFSDHTSCDWFDIKVPVTNDINVLKEADVLIISSPHHVHLADLKIKAKKVAFFQMLEHLFTNDRVFLTRCKRWYQLPGIIISRWGMEELNKMGNMRLRYIGNGVNFNDFPIYSTKKDNKTILLESPEPINKSKDKNRIALSVAKRLQSEGYNIIGYGAIKPNIDCEFHVCPDLKTMNKLYRDATIMIKATVYDFRSTAPLEAGTKGTVTARAIMYGDDDLIDGFNCLRVPYNENELYRISKTLLEREELRNTLAKNMTNYLKENSWDNVMIQWNQALGSF